MINFKVTTEKQEDNEGVFMIEPLEAGFGHTLGTSLRRVLLSHLQGAAISYVKINGVSHQFSTISGMVEDVTELVLNLKKVRFKLFSDRPAKMVLQATGKGEVRARQINTQGAGEVVSPDLYIATLTDPKAKLSIEMTVEKGVGYVTADERKSNEIGVMPIDSIFSPVIAVSYNVEPTRVGRRTDFDKLTLTIKTDGTIKPEQALTTAAEILLGYFKQIIEPVPEATVVTEKPALADDVLRMSVEELDLPVRITNALKAIDIDLVENLVGTPRTHLMKAKNLGNKSLTLISEKLAERGLALREA